MAKRLPGGRWTGKLGTWVYRRNGTRQRYVKMPEPMGRPQRTMRQRFKRLAAEWRRMTLAERERWNRCRAARRASWSGYTAFVAAGLRHGRTIR